MMKRIALLFCLSLFRIYAFAQENVSENIDSLTKALENSGNDTLKVILLNELTNAHWEEVGRKYSEEAARYNAQSILLSKQLGYYKGLGTAFLNKGRHEISATNKYAVATSDLLEGLYNFEKINDSNGISKSFLQLGVVSFILLYYDDAIKNLQQAISFAKDDPNIRATAIYLTAISYSELNRIEEAKTYFARALNDYNLTGNNHGKTECYIYLGKMYLNIDEIDTGMYYLHKAINMIPQESDSAIFGRPFSFLSTAHLKLNNIPEAIRYASISYRLGRKAGDEITIIESVNTLNKAYYLKKDYVNAYLYMKELKEMKDSIFNNSVAQRVAESKSKFMFEKELNDRKLKQEKEEAISNAQIQKQKILQYAFIVGIILLIVLLLVIMNRSRLKQKSAKQLTEAYDNLKATQQQLVQQEKLASLGSLTAGIAHEIKNPLNFVNNFSDLSLELIDEIKIITSEEERNEILDDLKANLNKISLHGKRADNIVKSMLQHSRSGLGEKQLTDVNRICDEFIDLSFHGMRSKESGFNSEKVKSLSPHLPKLNIIPQDFSRVILNLCTNAFYAVKKRTDIEGIDLEKYRPKVEIFTLLKENHIEIVIRDNGTGIPENIREKIFEPFFTTKPTGEGTGLGLSICYDIIQSHGGEITVDSRINEYTQFVISLPV